ncbi:MAG: sugar-binding transcriptional regulator [Ardenticatenaceae bacterium]|nr:sugar-binding transcriptional regulator [Ardenticatenaceae bacterium]MCB9442602.1 sugar-binding transcriptional regulator [Ardenticatenaceae bacterium]
MQSQEEMLVHVARMYYERGQTQAEIGRQFHISRSTVSRLLQEARDRNVVRISINYPWKRDYDLERQIFKHFQLREVRVLQSMDRPMAEVFKGVGMLAAEYLDNCIRDGMTLGVSYGRSIAATIQQLNPSRHVDMTVVQILGALGSGNPLIEGPDLVREIATLYGATYRYLFTPMIVESEQTRNLLLQEPYVQETLELGRSADVVILGIGAHAAESSGLIWTGYLNQKDIAFLRSRGAVGHMCAQHFDDQGRELDVTFNRRVISIGLDALRKIETVIAIAGTQEKAPAILGALRGNYIDVLITDDKAARYMLAA